MSITGGETKSFKILFGEDGEFRIPKYQRDYVWTKQNVQQLLNDIDENEKGHFIGTLILYSETKKTHEIIDGQQRTTTLSLILNVLYKKLDDMYDPLKAQMDRTQNKNYNSTLKALEDILIYDGRPKLILSETNQNNDKYLHLLHESNLIIEDRKINNFGNTSFAKTNKYIEELIENIIDEREYTITRLEKIISFTDKVLSVIIAPISTDKYADAYNLFECINNRGMDLSPIDLIKNLAFKEYTNIKNNDIEKIDNDWKEIIENLKEPYLQGRFLRHYYNAFKYNENVKHDSISRATNSNTSKIYENIIRNKKGVEWFINEFKAKSEIYSNLLNEENMDIELKEDLLKLKRVGLAPAYSFLLYLFSEHQENKDLLINTIKFLIKYGFRRNLTDYPATRNLDQMFIDLTEECRKKQNLKIADIITFLTNEKYCAPFEKVIENLKGNMYEENIDITRFILCYLKQNKKISTKEKEELFKDLWAKNNNNKYLFEIEHILPQKAELSKEWIDMIANNNKDEAIEIRDKYKHLLGNLTLSAYNQSLGKMSFCEKRDRTDSKGNFIGYKNGLAINDDLKDETIWNKEKIITRTNNFIMLILNDYRINEIDPEIKDNDERIKIK